MSIIWIALLIPELSNEKRKILNLLKSGKNNSPKKWIQRVKFTLKKYMCSTLAMRETFENADSIFEAGNITFSNKNIFYCK